MTLSYEERDAIVNYRIEKAKETFKEVESIIVLEYWSNIANRLYYSAYYMVSALLTKNNYVAHTHTGTRSLFYQYFVKTNIVNKDSGRIYSKLFELRQSSDYDDFFDVDENDILPLIEQVKMFINEIEGLINEKK
jgi:uncharacterized protein (UPF0332 family)